MTYRPYLWMADDDANAHVNDWRELERLRSKDHGLSQNEYERVINSYLGLSQSSQIIDLAGLMNDSNATATGNAMMHKHSRDRLAAMIFRSGF